MQHVKISINLIEILDKDINIHIYIYEYTYVCVCVSSLSKLNILDCFLTQQIEKRLRLDSSDQHDSFEYYYDLLRFTTIRLI